MLINFGELHCEWCEPNPEFIKKYTFLTTLSRCNIHGIAVHWPSYKEQDKESDKESDEEKQKVVGDNYETTTNKNYC